MSELTTAPFATAEEREECNILVPLSKFNDLGACGAETLDTRECELPEGPEWCSKHSRPWKCTLLKGHADRGVPHHIAGAGESPLGYVVAGRWRDGEPFVEAPQPAKNAEAN